MKKVLIVIDYQADFVDGSLSFPAAVALEGPICTKIRKARAEGTEVIFTFDTHSPDYLSTQEGRNLPVAHCIEGTTGWELYGEVEMCIRDRVAIVDQGRFTGCVGVDGCGKKLYPTQKAVESLKIIAQVISTFLLKKNTREKLDQAYQTVSYTHLPVPFARFA